MCSTETLVLRSSQELSPRFLFYFLLNPLAIENINSSTYGAKMPRANWDFIGDQLQLLPPLREQLAIVTFLDHETSRIDKFIAKKRRLLELLHKERLIAISTVAITRGLNNSVVTKNSGIDWLGRIPVHWKLHSLKRIARRIDIGTAEAATHAYVEAGVPIIRTTNVSADHIDVSDIRHIDPAFAEKNRSKFLYSGDLLTVRTGIPGTGCCSRRAKRLAMLHDADDHPRRRNGSAIFFGLFEFSGGSRIFRDRKLGSGSKQYQRARFLVRRR